MKIEQFRTSRADELKTAANTLETVFSSINTSPIHIAADILKSSSPTLKDGTTNPDYWGYQIEDFVIPVDTTKHLKPNIIDNQKVELILNMGLIADSKHWDSLNDPLVELYFNVTVRGVSKEGNHYFCFHLDKHDMSTITDEPHPVYHIQYSANPNGDPNFKYGETMMLDTPRLMHHPLDFILGIGFLTNNFFPLAFDDILEDGYFNGLYKRYQTKIMKPYYHTIANHWQYNTAHIIWKPIKDLCPFIV